MSFPSKNGSHPIKDEVGYRLSKYISLSLSNAPSLSRMHDTKLKKSPSDSGSSSQLPSKTRMSLTLQIYFPQSWTGSETLPKRKHEIQLARPAQQSYQCRTLTFNDRQWNHGLVGQRFGYSWVHRIKREEVPKTKISLLGVTIHA